MNERIGRGHGVTDHLVEERVQKKKWKERSKEGERGGGGGQG